MSFMSDTRSFVDTNIFVYAADESAEEKEKHELATGVLTTDPDRLVISAQVLQEFYVTVTRKLRTPLSEARAAGAVQGMAKLEVVRVDGAIVCSAVDASREARISLWDALIVEAARAAGCSRVLTEDLSHGQVIRGVTIENPLRSHPGGHGGG